MFSFSLLNTNWQNEILVNETNNLIFHIFYAYFTIKKIILYTEPVVERSMARVLYVNRNCLDHSVLGSFWAFSKGISDNFWGDKKNHRSQWKTKQKS
jgi:hypothetical protein